MKLRNYSQYLKKLRRYAKLAGFRIRISWKKEVDGYGYYVPDKRLVVVQGYNQSDSEVISTLLHEIGHLLDDFKNPKEFAHYYSYQGRVNLELDKTLTRNQKAQILKREKEAWKQARGLAKLLKIPLGKWFDEDEKQSLNTYRYIKTRD